MVTRPTTSARDKRTATVTEAARAEIREEFAAYLHDTVLQTYALIATWPEIPQSLRTLARRNERQLRSWLRGESAPGANFATALEALCGEVDEAYDVEVDLIVSGQMRLTRRTEMLLLATREAIVNAAKHSGASRIDVYAELRNEAIVFVRDRGCGFDPSLISAGRRGIQGSLRRRMRSIGGRAKIRSSPGTGTEVTLTVPTP